MCSEYSTAIELFVENYIVPYGKAVNLQNQNLYRKHRLYYKSVEKELKHAQDSLKRIFIRYCKRPRWINDEVFKEREQQKNGRRYSGG